MNITLYTTNCPQCRILESKLKDANINFEVVNDVDLMIQKGFMMAPVLEVDGVAHSFKEAVKWIGEQ